MEWPIFKKRKIEFWQHFSQCSTENVTLLGNSWCYWHELVASEEFRACSRRWWLNGADSVSNQCKQHQ